jgi:hypothetical protein
MKYTYVYDAKKIKKISCAHYNYFYRAIHNLNMNPTLHAKNEKALMFFLHNEKALMFFLHNEKALIKMDSKTICLIKSIF